MGKDRSQYKAEGALATENIFGGSHETNYDEPLGAGGQLVWDVGRKILGLLITHAWRWTLAWKNW